MINIAQLPTEYDLVVEIIKPSGAFLVGGAVRDLLLERDIHDLDFSMPGSTIKYAKDVADKLKGDYYLLDKDRQAARVILKGQDQKRIIVDFTTFQGKTIDEDLASRDFTITSMALDINHDLKLIDPFNGAKDILEGLIRCTTTDSVLDDPIRSIRAVRMASQLGFRILAETKDQIQCAREGISNISPERIRDEIFRMLEGPQQSTALQTLQHLGIFPLIFGNKLSETQGKLVKKMVELWKIMQEDHDQDTSANWVYGLYTHRLGRYREKIRDHLLTEPVPGRSVYQLSLLLPLVMDNTDPVQEDHLVLTHDYSAAEQMSLSNQELQRLEKSILAGTHFQKLAINKNRMLPIEIYRFFRECKEAGIEGIIFALASLLVNEERSIQESDWLEQLDCARSLLEGWWEKRSEWIDPPSLLNGDDLQEELCLEPGPEIGVILEELREAQVRFGLDNKQDALDFIKNSQE